jgi:isoleucyl-tRNA synthetase
MRASYDTYDFQAIFQAVNELVTVDLSAFYLDVSKDRLYTFSAASRERRSAQTVQYVIADGLARLLAPIVSITADEIWKSLPGAREDSIHLAEFPAGLEAWLDADLEDRWATLLDVRRQVNGALEVARQAKTIGSALGAHVTVSASGDTLALLRAHEADLPMFFITSAVTVEERRTETADRVGGGVATADSMVSVAVAPAPGEKCPRCWRIVTETATSGPMAGLCARCEGALRGDGVGR